VEATVDWAIEEALTLVVAELEVKAVELNVLLALVELLVELEDNGASKAVTTEVDKIELPEELVVARIEIFMYAVSLFKLLTGT
jgi:hypothetical protein